MVFPEIFEYILHTYRQTYIQKVSFNYIDVIRYYYYYCYLIFCTPQHLKFQLLHIENLLSPDQEITFTSTPSSIVPKITKELQMLCEIEDDPYVKHVVSIGITRGKQRVASVSDFHAAQPDADLSQIQVWGAVTDEPGVAR